MKQKIIVGLSGGVDSSVVALILKNENKSIIECAFMRNWDSLLNNDILGNDKINSKNICSQELDFIDAQTVSKKMDLKLHRIDFIKEYWDYVFKYFIEEYKNGRTPNPDILCNKYIKFDKFLNYALKKWNCNFIATGHYARIKYNKKLKEYQLLKAKDKLKDQSYFLCQLNQKQLSKVLFPLGELLKSEVRKIAKINNLSTANKKDSTGICFIGERNFNKFLQNYIPLKPGDIINISNNKKVGTHNGVMYYTLGQRKGLELGGMPSRFFVIGKNIAKKIIYVADKNENKWLYATRCIVNNFNFINKIKSKTLELKAKFRYRQKDSKVRVNILENNKVEIILLEQVRAVTSGQYAVLYKDDICLGGGSISKTFNLDVELEYFK